MTIGARTGPGRPDQAVIGAVECLWSLSRKRVAAGLRPVYRAVNADAAEAALAAFDEKWGQKYPMIAASWRQRWAHIVPFLALPAELRRAVYTTNSIENLNRQIR